MFHLLYVTYLLADNICRARVKAGVPVWRARYFGEWPNLNPLEWLGAYHSSKLIGCVVFVSGGGGD